MRDILDEVISLRHDGHVRLDYRIAKPAELLVVLPAHDLTEASVRHVVVLEKTGNLEERSEEGVPLHSQLKVLAVRRLTCNPEAGQRVHPDLLVDDLLPEFGRNPLPHRLGILLGLPDKRASLVEAVERVGVSERLWVATQNHVDMVQIAVDPHPLWGDDQEVGGRSPLLLRPVPRVGTDVQYLFGPAEVVEFFMRLKQVISDRPDDLAEVLPGCDHPPPANGMEPHRDRVFGEQRRRTVGLDRVWMVDSEHEIGVAVGYRLSVLAGANPGGVLVGADDRLGTKVARAQAVGAAENQRHLIGGQWLDAVVVSLVMRFDRLGKRSTHIASQRIVDRERFVGSLENDRSLLPCQSLHHGRLREGPEYVDVDRPDLGVVVRPQEVNSCIDVLGGRAE